MKEEVQKLKGVQRGNGEENPREVENVWGLHESQ